MCVHTSSLISGFVFFIKVWSHFSQDQKAINKLFDLQVWKTFKNQVCHKATIEKPT
jgi:hypothetical protein